MRGVGKVESVWRFPVKSMAGEGLERVFHGDAGQLRVEVETPSAEVLALDDPRLVEMLGEGIGEEHVLSLFRSERSLTDCRPISLISLQTIRSIEDKVGIPVDPLRFRANLYLDLSGDGDATEEDWIGRSLRIGEKVTVAVLERDPRCKMITLDPGTGESNPAILREVAQARGGMAGLYCAVLIEGVVRVGDEVHLL